MLNLKNMSLKNSKLRKAGFDGATMDKISYAILKNGKGIL